MSNATLPSTGIQLLLSAAIEVGSDYPGAPWHVTHETAWVVFTGIVIPTRCSGRIEVGGTVVRWRGKLESVQRDRTGWRCEFAVEGEEVSL